MNKIKEIKLDKTNWLEVTWIDGNNKEFHCESFGDTDEYIDLLNQRCIEFDTPLSKEDEKILAEQKANRYIPTSEEIEQQKIEEAKLLLEQKKYEAKTYLSNTDFYYPRYLETGESVPSDVVLKRQEYRAFLRDNQ